MGDDHDRRRGDPAPEGAAGGEPISTTDAVAGRHVLPPGYVPPPPGRRFVNPYIARLAEYPELILDGQAAEALRGRWAGAFPSPGPLEVEIGSGNGFYLQGLCERHPRRRFVGLEIRYKRVWMAARKLDRAGLPNGRVVLFHAGYLARLFAPGEVSRFHLNHPDPWPKDRHARNRLINPAFCRTVAELLPTGGRFVVKSDCMPYVDELRRGFAGLPVEEEAFTADLHRPGEPLAEGNILTNYERKFVQRGLPVFLMRLLKTG